LLNSNICASENIIGPITDLEDFDMEYEDHLDDDDWLREDEDFDDADWLEYDDWFPDDDDWLDIGDDFNDIDDDEKDWLLD